MGEKPTEADEQAGAARSSVQDFEKNSERSIYMKYEPALGAAPEGGGGGGAGERVFEKFRPALRQTPIEPAKLEFPD